MSKNQDRASAWDGNKAVDTLIGKGGAAVWSVRGELAPRAALRHVGDPIETLAEVAALYVGIDRLVEGLAKQMKVPVEDLRQMLSVAREDLEPRMETATRIKKAGT